MDEKWLRSGTAQFNKEEREVYAALQYAASCDCLVAEWHDCEEHKPKPKEQSVSVDTTRKLKHIARCGVQPQEDTVA